jgi:hypothetical protein
VFGALGFMRAQIAAEECRSCVDCVLVPDGSTAGMRNNAPFETIAENPAAA